MKKKKKLERDGRRDPAMRAHTHTDGGGVQPARCKYNREDDANTIVCIMQIQQVLNVKHYNMEIQYVAKRNTDAAKEIRVNYAE